MYKALFILVVFLPLTAMADNVGQCGWGSKLFDGQKGVGPQVLAVTTNGTFGNQTFAISSGTSGCTQEGVVTSSWKTAAYIDGNMNKLARDMSRGEGESVSALASLLQIPGSEQAAFGSTLQNHFGEIFPTSETSSTEVVTALRNVLASNNTFSRYAANV
jgi:hypothetical protein